MKHSLLSFLPKIALIMGNGPSAKLIDFEKISDGRFASVGMNAAYRYWEKIDFRPTHYICMDDVVLMSHADKVYELIHEGRIQKFFLRDQIKDKYPDLAGNEQILWFSDVHKTDIAIFNTDYVTTGSWAIRWMAYEGMSSVILTGIDSNYVEIIQGAKKIGDSDDLRLVMEKTPKFNPNYFFGDYQQAGDLYNIPNDPQKIKDGQIVHIEALRETKDDLRKAKCQIKIVDTSPLSGHQLFEKRPIDKVIKDLQIAVVTSFYSAAPADEVGNNIRIAVKNAKNPYVGRLIIMLEGNLEEIKSKTSEQIISEFLNLLNNDKIQLIDIPSRPDYLTIFNLAKNAGWSYYAVINSDIYLNPEMIHKVLSDKLYQNEMSLIALSRWNRTDNGLFLQTTTPSPPWQEIRLEKLMLHEKNFLTYDCYISSIDIELPENLQDIFIGEFGCDTAIISVFRLNGIAVSNPCLRYIIEHEDNKIRNYHNLSGVRQKARVIKTIKNLITHRYRHSQQIIKSLNSLDLLNSSTTNIGRFITVDSNHKNEGIHENWFKFFRLLGSATWEADATVIPVRFCKLRFDANTLEEDSPSLLQKIFYSIQNGDFIEIEVVNNKLHNNHYLGLTEKNISDFERIKQLLHYYDWHSVVHLDHATDSEQMIFSDIMLVLKDVLSNFIKKAHFNPLYPDEAVNIISHNMKLGDPGMNNEEIRTDKLSSLLGLDFRKEFYKFKGLFPIGNVTEVNNVFTINPTFQANYLAFTFHGIIEPEDKLLVKVYMKLLSSSKVFIMVCRDGHSVFESVTRNQLVTEGLQKYELSMKFEHHHAGFRVQLGAVDSVLHVTDLGVEVSLHRGDKIIVLTARNVPEPNLVGSTEKIRQMPYDQNDDIQTTVTVEPARNMLTKSSEISQSKDNLLTSYLKRLFSNTQSS